jgi:hypothetical protein
MATLQDEIISYDAMRADLEARHLGMWALVKSGSLVNVYPDFASVAADAVKRFGRGPYLIRQIGARAVDLPASLVMRAMPNAESLRGS